MKIDMHIHMYYDKHRNNFEFNRKYLEGFIRSTENKGLDGICITNHDTFVPSRQLEDFGKRVGFPVFVGVEYSSSDGHLLVYGFDDENYIRNILRPAQDVIDHVVERGGVVIPSHPYTTSNSYTMGDRVHRLKGLIALETMNGTRPVYQNALAERARQRLRLKGIGGSDSHGPSGIGVSYTVFSRSIRTIGELVDELRNGSYYPEYLSKSGESKFIDALHNLEGYPYLVCT